MKKYFLLTVACLLSSVNASADSLLGLYVGAHSWQQNYDGHIRDLDASNPLFNAEIDFNRDLGLDDETGNVVYIAFEHGIPVLPNIKLQHTELEIEATNVPSSPIEYGGKTFSTSINSESDLSHTDITFYYQVLDNWVSLDLGFTVRLFDGFVSVEDSASPSTFAKEEFDAAIPLLYIAAKFDLPFSGLYAGVSANGLGYDGNNFIDYQATLGYESSLGLGLEVGFRSMSLELDDIDDIEADLTIDGGFIGVFYHF